MLNEISNALKQLLNDPATEMDFVFYGGCAQDVMERWNFFVFRRSKSARKNDVSYTDYYEVLIVHEDFIPEDYEKTVANKIMQDTSLRLVQDVTFGSVPKPNTQVMIEVATLTFSHAKKMTGSEVV